MKKEQKGFTLIELLVVVTIIGILAAAAIPKLLAAMDKARVGRCNADIAAVKSAASMYYMDLSYYPTGTGGMTTSYLDNVPKGGAGVALEITSSSGTYTITCKATSGGCYTYFVNTTGEVLTSGTGCP